MRFCCQRCHRTSPKPPLHPSFPSPPPVSVTCRATFLAMFASVPIKTQPSMGWPWAVFLRGCRGGAWGRHAWRERCDAARRDSPLWRSNYLARGLAGKLLHRRRRRACHGTARSDSPDSPCPCCRSQPAAAFRLYPDGYGARPLRHSADRAGGPQGAAHTDPARSLSTASVRWTPFWTPAHAGDWLWQIAHYLFEAASTLSRNRLGTREVHVPAERNAAGAQAVDDAKFGAGCGIVQPWMTEQGADRHEADRIPP